MGGYLLPADTFLKVSALRVKTASSHLWFSRRMQVKALSREASLVDIHQSWSLPGPVCSADESSASCSLEGRDQGHQVREARQQLCFTGRVPTVNLNYPSPLLPAEDTPNQRKRSVLILKGNLKMERPTLKENNVLLVLCLGTADMRLYENNHECLSCARHLAMCSG